jgi:peptide/nickel transport system permease protein
MSGGRLKALIYNLKRFAGFLGLFFRNSRGILGVAMIALFAAIAFFPNIFTPYDPVNDRQLGGYLAAPIWLRYLPKDLGGLPGLSDNLQPMVNSNFTDPSLEGWNFSLPDHTSVRYEQNVGNQSGVLHLVFERDEVGKAYGNVTASISQTFYFPYSGPPFSFDARIICFLNGTKTLVNTTAEIPTPGVYPFPVVAFTKETFDVPMRVGAYVDVANVNRTLEIWPLKAYHIYVYPGMEGLSADDTFINCSQWLDTSASTPLSSWGPLIAGMTSKLYGASRLAAQIFFPNENCPGYYTVGFNVTFIDVNSTKPVRADVYLASYEFSLLGTGWGIMGADHWGRDLWSQLLYGTKVSLYVGVLSSAMAVVIGLVVGLMAGYLGRVVDEFLMRVCDVLLVLPGLPLLIVLVAVLGTSIDNLIILLGALGWMGFARLVRSQVISLRERPFIEAARAVGASKTHIMFRHILPNVMSLVYVTLATTVPGNIVAEASLGFLGFGDPNRSSWGLMLNEMAANQAYRCWWWVIPPGLCIAAIAIAFIMLGYALDEVLNPKLRLRK